MRSMLCCCRLIPILSAVLLSQAVFGQMAVSPSRFELDLDSGPGAQAVRVSNLGQKAIAVEVRVLNWDLDEENRVRALPPEEQSLDQWMVINPLRFTVPAQGSQTVRFAIRPRVLPEPGEHRAMIFFEQVGQEESSGFEVRVRMGVAVYAQIGEARREGRLEEIEVDDQGAGLRIASEGNACVRLAGEWALWPVDSFPGAGKVLLSPEGDPPPGAVAAGSLPGTPVLPGTRRSVVARWPEPPAPGRYVLELKGQLGEESISRAVEVELAAPQEPRGGEAEEVLAASRPPGHGGR